MVGAKQIIPKYYQIAQDIIRVIQKGDLLPGDKIPSENDIITKYAVSNTTARKTLQEIERSGWVTRIKGKGTYVNRNKVERSANKILSFTKNMLQMGRKPSTRVLDTRVLRKDYWAAINGRRYKIQKPVCKIHRLRFADDVPMMLETRYVSLAFCPGIDKVNLEGSLYEIYEKQYSLQLKEIDQMLSVVMLAPGFQDFFDLKKPVPAFRVEGVTFCGKEMILEMEDSLYRADQYSFAIKAT